MHTVEENADFRAQLRARDLKPNDGFLKKEHVQASAGIQADKLEHQHRATYSQESGTTSVAEAHVIHVVKGLTGSVKSFEVGVVVACLAGATVTVDLLKNGVSILDAAIVIDNGDSAYALVPGVIDTVAVAHDDVLEVSVAVAAGGGTIGDGVFAYLDLHEKVD